MRHRNLLTMSQKLKTKILLLIDPPSFRDILLFNLEAKLNIELINPHSESEALGLLLTSEDIELIIIDSSITWPNFFKILSEKNTQYNCIEIFNNNSVALTKNFNSLERIPKDKIFERLPIFLDSYLKNNLKNEISNLDLDTDDVTLDYCRIKTGLLLEASPLKADIYIRLSNRKFLKLFLKGDTFEKSDLEKYLKTKKIEYLFLKNSETTEFLNKFENLIDTMLKSENLNTTVATQTAVTTLDTIQEISKNIGFTEEIQKVFKANVSLVIKTVSKNVKLSGLLSTLMNDQTKYISAHSIALAQVACSIADELEWKSDMTYQKLTTAALMHDIVLTNQELAKIKTLDELKSSNISFTQDEAKLFQVHTIQASDLAKSFREMPADVDQIILQHHEKPDGSGFPKNLSSGRISPLASLIIISHDIVNEVIDRGSKFNLNQFIEDKKEFYSSGNFKKVLTGVSAAKISFN